MHLKLIRINKFLSQCGVSSRRGAEKLIAEGRVTVNGEVVDHPGTVIDEDKDVVKVDGKLARLSKKRIYILLNKPRNVLTSMSDPFGRRTVAQFVKNVPARVYPVGRLDYDTEGALIMTNDGDLAYRLAHPKYQIKRVYWAQVEGAFTTDKSKLIAEGIELEDGHIGHGDVRLLTTGIKNSTVEITLTEGHKREVKQLFKNVGHPVQRLKRIRFANLGVDNLRLGRWRFLSSAEVNKLREMVGLDDESEEDDQTEDKNDSDQ